jgi:hypothetical protein
MQSYYKQAVEQMLTGRRLAKEEKGRSPMSLKSVVDAIQERGRVRGVLDEGGGGLYFN